MEDKWALWAGNCNPCEVIRPIESDSAVTRLHQVPNTAGRCTHDAYLSRMLYGNHLRENPALNPESIRRERDREHPILLTALRYVHQHTACTSTRLSQNMKIAEGEVWPADLVLFMKITLSL